MKDTTAELLAVFRDHSLTEREGINLLQDNAVISDNCIGACDVSAADLEAVERFFTRTQ